MLKWDDWQSQMSNRIDTLVELRNWVDVTEREEKAIRKSKGKYRWSITPYYASLMDQGDETCPIRLQAVPHLEEFEEEHITDVDPVGDMLYLKTNRVVHKYPDRVILLVTLSCAVYCRHCARKHYTADINASLLSKDRATSLEEDLDYIATHPAVRDVLLTGGDPLVYSDAKLEYLIRRLREIPSVEIIRIGTRFPVVLPQRITHELCDMLQRYHPVWLNTQFNHPKEVTEEAAAACNRLLRYGIPVQNQSVLLRGINDDLDTMRMLLRKLLQIRVRPYYLYHCDKAAGISHFSTSIEKGRGIIDGLFGYMTGFGVPQYVLTTKIGKIPISNDYVNSAPDGLVVTNYEGRRLNLGKVK